ncbi:hypothetical protein [Frondihabitans sp. 762G35]|uniref:hypothetical protein n=1 Tax=Frondihabitans sp. 762G35 TaxID=1446794 RepID=UPI000F4FB3EA|nr:hypothetical protein [Frondihabitans sp. 762G35]
MTEPLIAVGYWRNANRLDLLDVGASVNAALTTSDAEDTANYLSRGFVARAWMGRSTCRICGATNGSLDLSDGIYVWPEGLAHYVPEHKVQLPNQFLTHLESQSEALEKRVIDESWWSGQVATS